MSQPRYRSHVKLVVLLIFHMDNKPSWLKKFTTYNYFVKDIDSKC